MNDKHLVSVVVPVYNTEKYIETTLQSILNQTYDNLEIIVVDDGSQDKSASIVMEIQSKYPDIIQYVYQKNQGVAVARNAGIHKATGEYVAFLDSDDFWHKSKIEKQMNSINSNKMEACYCGFVNFLEDTSEEVKQATKFKKGDITEEFLTHQIFAQTSTWVIRKSILLKNNIYFTPGASWGEDLEFIFKVISVSTVCYVNEYLTYYRILSNGNLSSKYRNYDNKTEKELAVFERVREWIDENRNKLISLDRIKLLTIIDKYVKPHIIIDNACIYFKMNNDINKGQCKLISDDLSRYARKIYYHNGKRSLKLLIKLMYVRLQIKRYT